METQNTMINIAEYIYQNFEDDNVSNNVLSQLLLVDDDLLAELFDLLINNKIGIETLKANRIINNSTVKNLINKTLAEDGNYTKVFYMNTLKNVYNFDQYRYDELSGFKLYINSKIINPVSYTVTLKYDLLNPTASLAKFTDIRKQYPKVIAFNTRVQERYSVIKQTYKQLNIKLPAVEELIELCMKEPIFINSPFNRKNIASNKLAIFILNRNFKYTSPILFDKVYDNLLNQMVLNDDENRDTLGWTAVSKEIELHSWSKLEKTSNEEFDDVFNTIRILRIFYPRLYQREDNETSILVEDKMKLNQLMDFLELVRDLLMNIQTTLAQYIKEG